MQRLGAFDGVAAVARFADDFHVWLTVDQQGQPLPDGLVILGDQHADPVHRDGASHSSNGQRRKTVVPLPGADSTSAVPPISAARSRMPISPMPRPCTVGSAGSKPTPSSSMTRTMDPSRASSSTSTRLACACLKTL